MLANDRLIRAIFRQKLDRTPVWMMRQAGRYLPEYREVRKKAGDFLSLCKNPELACQVTLQPIERFPLDAAIIFSDILTIPDAFGLDLQFVEGEGPCFNNPIRTSQAITSLPHIIPELELAYVMDAIRMAKQALGNKLPLIGFAGSPWTLACYMIEGSTSKNFNEIKRFLYRDPVLLHQLLSHLSHATTDYLNAQIAAGVDVLMIFDTWGGLLSRSHYLEFSLRYMQEIIQGLKPAEKKQKVPVILFTKNSGLHLEEISRTACDAIGLDWMTDLREARQKVGNRVALQGNLDPAALYAEPDIIKQSVKRILEEFGQGSGHIFNLGHGISPDVDPSHVAVMIEAVHEWSPAYHR